MIIENESDKEILKINLEKLTKFDDFFLEFFSIARKKYNEKFFENLKENAKLKESLFHEEDSNYPKNMKDKFKSQSITKYSKKNPKIFRDSTNISSFKKNFEIIKTVSLDKQKSFIKSEKSKNNEFNSQNLKVK